MKTAFYGFGLWVSMMMGAPFAHAALQAISCNACTQAQYDTKAYNDVVGRQQAQGFTAVYDLTNNQLIKYTVAREPKVGGWQYTVEQTSATSAEINAWNVERSAIARNSGSSMFFAHTRWLVPFLRTA